MRRRRRSSFGWLERFYLVVLLGLLFGGSIWLDSRGTTVTGTVHSRSEDIVLHGDPQGTWYRWYRVAVEFPAVSNIGTAATIDVSEARFDSLAKGDTIQVRYLPFLPLMGRAADRSTLDAVIDAGSRLVSNSYLTTLVVWLVAGLVTLWIASRIGVPAIVAAGLGWIAIAFPMHFPEPPRVVMPSAQATARVTSVRLVTKSPERRAPGRRRMRGFSSDAVRRLDQPYQVVEFRFAAPGQRDSVFGVDAVDSASVPGLEFGATLPIRYDPDTPRDARLAEGSRTFLEKNRYHFVVPAIGVGLLGMLGAWGARSRRVRRARRDSHRSEDRRPAVQTEMRLSFVLLAAGLSLTAKRLPAQTWKSNPACTLITTAQVREITGQAAYGEPSQGEALGEGYGGGASCQFGGRSRPNQEATPIISVTYIPKGPNALEQQRKQPLRPGCKREKVEGVGEDALYEACESGPGAVVVTRKGATDLLVQIQAKPATDPAAKSTVIALAKAAVAGVK